METLDEYGERWDVQRGDPASGPLAALIRSGLPLEYVILPRSVLMFGMTGLPLAATMEVSDDESNVDTYCRYWDTVEALRGGNFG